MAGVYISYPFCAQKCTYCNFASGVMPGETERQYPTALMREIRAAQFDWTPNTVYLGGGTPSSMDLDTLDEVLSAVPGRKWREATLEAAPGTITSAKAARWREAGINRVSLGVQSFIHSELARTGRRHTAEIVAGDVAVLRAAGLANLNLDLIAGLPGQTREGWRASLDWIECLDPPHVSVYMLEVDEDSRLGKEILLGGARYGAGDVPEDEAIAEFYETAVERLADMGIARYEISNFARPGFESIHNLKYWRREPYLGFGADAHSCDGGRRWQNVEAASEYVARSPQVRVEDTRADESEEKFFVGLRLAEGVETDSADWLRHGAAIRRFVDSGLIERVGERLRLTPRGVMVSNEIFQEFV